MQPAVCEPPLLHEDGTVVEWRGGQEEREEQILRDGGVERPPRLDVIVECRFAFEHHQRSDALAGERLRGLDDLLDHHALGLVAAT